MDQGQQAPPVPQAQPAIAAAPLVLPAPPPPPLVVPAPPVFALGLGCSHAVLDYDDRNKGATATKLYNKAIAPLEEKFDGEADNLAVGEGDGANRRWDDEKLTHPLRASVLGEHQDACNYVYQHAYA